MPAADLLSLLRAHRLLEPERLELIARLSGTFPDPRALAKDLIQRGWLTAFQVNKLLQGRGNELVLGQYVLLERLGQGGMGEVFKARHGSLDRLVALKVIRKELTSKPEAIKRFRREVQAVAQLAHPNIVMAFDANQVGDTFFLAMEYVEGTDLGRLVKSKGPMKVRDACDAIRQGALGLQHAFERGLVHRDIKPTNLLRASQGGLVKLVDMGLARLQEVSEGDDSSLDPIRGIHAASLQTQAGRILGTPDYIAPEQARNSHTVDIRADLYSLGCTFYYVLLGWPPFPGGTSIEKLVRHQTETAKPVEQIRPEVPAAVGAVIRKLLAKRPENRYQTPGQLAAALAGVSNVPRATPAFPAGARETFVASRALIAQLLAQAQAQQVQNLPTARPSGAVPVATAIPATQAPSQPAARSPWEAMVAEPDAARARGSERWWWILAAIGGCFLLISLVLFLSKGGKASPRSNTTEPSRPVSARKVAAKAPASPTFLSDLPEIRDGDADPASFSKNGDLGHDSLKIVVRGKPSPKGIALQLLTVRTPGEVNYQLDHQYATFVATAALNDRNKVARGLTVVFELQGDGKPLWKSRPLSYGEIEECSVSVAGIDKLKMAVVATRGPIFHADPVWVEPRLLRVQ